jgi:hypothetical protein
VRLAQLALDARWIAASSRELGAQLLTHSRAQELA